MRNYLSSIEKRNCKIKYLRKKYNKWKMTLKSKNKD